MVTSRLTRLLFNPFGPFKETIILNTLDINEVKFSFSQMRGCRVNPSLFISHVTTIQTLPTG